MIDGCTLFITRKFPPSVGGMQRVSYELYKKLSSVSDVRLVKWSGSNKWLPFVFPCLLVKSLCTLALSHVKVIYLQDGLLSPLGVLLKLFRKPVVITIHGKDITHDSMVYQSIIPGMVNKMDKVICVSEATAVQCVQRGVSRERTVVITNGIEDDLYSHEDRNTLKKQLAERLGFSPASQLLLSVGRLVERKGIKWFLENVFPAVIEEFPDCLYLIVGSGSFFSEIRKTIETKKLNAGVRMLGSVDDETLRLIYNSSDVFVMPNIPVKGDMEGFGVVALEAASCCLPVVASDLEGIKDAIRDGENGFLLESGNAVSFLEKITEFLRDERLRETFGMQARKVALENYGWSNVAKSYLNEFISLKPADLNRGQE